MYFLLLFLTAFLLISIFSTNWPVKLYHDLFLRKIARELGTEPVRHGLLLSGVYSEILTVYQGKEIKIRFLESSIDSIKANSGLEIRIKADIGLIMEFYRTKLNRKPWGDFHQFNSGDQIIDSEWLILTTDLDRSKELWERTQLAELLRTIPQLDQILINHQEIIIQLRKYQSIKTILNIINRVIPCFP